jgi:hypothetical protein
VKWYVRGCTVCHGDLHDDMETPGYARCLMCGRSYVVAQDSATLQVVSTPATTQVAEDALDIAMPSRWRRSA